MATNVQPSSVITVTWPIVVESGGACSMHLMHMDSRLTSSVMKERIMALYYREQPWWSRWLCKPAIGIVTIIGSIDSESHANNGQQVFVKRNSPSSFDPAASHIFTTSFCSSLAGSSPPRAILLKRQLSHIGLIIATMAVLLAIVAPGLFVWGLAGQAQLGITLSATIAGTFALAGNLRGHVGNV